METLLPVLNIKERISQLYVPILILENEDNVKSLGINEHTLTDELYGIGIGASFMNEASLFNIVNRVYVKSETASLFYTFSSEVRKLASSLVSAVDLITGNKQVKAAFSALKELHEKLEKEYADYKESHNNFCEKISTDIKSINDYKCTFKEYVLCEVSKKLKEIGVESKVESYQIEEFDINQLELNKGLEGIMQEMSVIEKKVKTSYEWMDYFLLLNSPVIKIFERWVVLRKLKAKIEEFNKEFPLEKKCMESDLEKMGTISMAFSNVRCIFEDIYNRFVPIIVDIIKDLGTKYHTYADIPDCKRMSLHMLSMLLKQLAEKRILKNKTAGKVIEKDVVDYSNSLSKKYVEIKRILLVLDAK